MKRETIDAVRGHLQTVAAGLADMAAAHSDKANALHAGDDQRMHADLSNKCIKLGGICVSCHKALEDGADTEPTVNNERNRGAGGDLDGPKILVGSELMKAFDELNKVRGALPDMPTLVNRFGGAPLPDTAKVPEEFRKLVEV